MSDGARPNHIDTLTRGSHGHTHFTSLLVQHLWPLYPLALLSYAAASCCLRGRSLGSTCDGHAAVEGSALDSAASASGRKHAV